MDTKGTKEAKAVRYGLIPCAPIRRVVNAWAAENWWMDCHQMETSKTDELGCAERLANFVGVSCDLIIRIRALNHQNPKPWIEFDTADKIITFINPMLWRTDPELAEIYQGFNFAWLDLNRPTSPAVTDELVELSGVLSQYKLAHLYGVSQSTVYRALQRGTVAA